MQGIVDAQSVAQDRWIEIRSHWPAALPATSELEHLSASLSERNRLIRIEGQPELDATQLAVLADPLAELVLDGHQPMGIYLDIFCRPGVTDAEGEAATLALAHAGAAHLRCHAGFRYRFAGDVPPEQRPAIERLLGNPLIHEFSWSDEPIPAAAFDHVSHDSVSGHGIVQTVDLRAAGDEELLVLSRELGLGLDLAEMRAISDHFQALGRPATDVELQSLALTWSEHCSHKTFKATINFDHDGQREVIPGLLQTYIVAPTVALHRPWVRSAFVDNAGVMAFDRRYDLAFKVETHNHPAALEPYGGAHTGVGGVIRDILAVSAEPIANTDVLCFGPLDLPDHAVPAGAFHPRLTSREVVRGVADYGNNMGIPTIGGAVLYHPGYTTNPLVYCGTLGIAPRDSHPRAPEPGDAVVVLGGRTGRDGLHGATMSSASLDRSTVAGSTVQIGAPITEKTLRDVLPRLRDERLYHAITDCGAGGLCSAVGEMGAALGVEVDLAAAPLKYQGLRPWEIWLSEAQERMVLAVAPQDLPRLFALCHTYDVAATVIGRFRDDGTLRISYGSQVVADLAMSFLHDGRPPRTLQARWRELPPAARPIADAPDPSHALLRLLGHPNIASKEGVIRRYDHEVGAGTVLKPLTATGGPSDATVLQPRPESRRGVVVAHGINPLYGRRDPHAMAMLVVDEALRNLVAVGGSIDRTALLDNFCWGDIDDPDELGALVRAAQGCHDAALTYGVPFVSGKDSLRNISVEGEERHSIPGTLLISAMGVIPDVSRTVTMPLKTAGHVLYLLGETGDELGGSHYLWMRDVDGGGVPQVRPETPEVMRRLSRAIHRGLVASCHDLAEGGLAVAAGEMALAGELGLECDLDRMPRATESAEALLFAESPGRFLVEVALEHCDRFDELLQGLPCARIGWVMAHDRLIIRRGHQPIIDLPLAAVDAAWRPLSSTSPGRELRPVGPCHPPCPIAETADRPLRNVSPFPTRPAEALGYEQTSTSIRALILAAPGVNCDPETAEACRLAGAEPEIVHLNQLLDGTRRLGDFGLLVLAGGFSYGDHLGAGTLLSAILRYQLLDDLQRFVDDERPVLGICNGFQVLARLGLLGEVTLAPSILPSAGVANQFECRWVPLQVEDSPCIFLEGLEELELPIAHGQGRVVTPLDHLPQLLSRAPLRYRENPNGSMADIAGVCNATGTVFGLMPHPERYVTRSQHPTRQTSPPAGLALFQNAVRYVSRL